MGTQISPAFSKPNFPGDVFHAPEGRTLAPAAVGHSVHFYEEDSVLLDNLSQFLGGTLGSGGACLVIATEAHREGLASRLSRCGIDLPHARRAHRYLALDAEETLGEFMVNGWPDANLFEQAFGFVMEQAQLSLAPHRGQAFPPIAAFGEMVSLLWEQGNSEAAVRLEELWNALARRYRFSLQCAYPMRIFGNAENGANFRRMCSEHTHVVPAESYSSLRDEDQRSRMVSDLQQKVQMLETALADREREIELRRESENHLKLAQAAVIQAEKLAAAGRLAATIAHEINNPLEAVTNFIYLAMTNPNVPEDVCQQLEIADRELARVAQIAQQTLGFYRDTSSARSTRIAKVIDDVLAVYDRRIKGKNITVNLRADPALELHIKQGELKQILANLIANAIDATPSGGQLWLRAKAARHWRGGMQRGVRISVGDDGCGMTHEVKQRLFVPFFTTKADVGTGIGLWVTRSLIEAQGGFVQFRSRECDRPGTVFSFFLPEQADLTAAVAA